MIYADFVRERISQLRIQKSVSEYQMSYDLGHSRGYINNISSGKALPSMSEFFAICDYFGISLMDFFDAGNKYPIHIQQLLDEAKKSEVEEIELTTEILKRFHGNK